MTRNRASDMDWHARRLYLLFTPASCRNEPWQTLRDSLAAGVELVQWRVKEPDPAGLCRCMELCAALEVPVIVNDQVELARQAGAAGAHVGQDDMDVAEARSRLLPGQCLGASTHDLDQALQAIAAGADHLGLGPCYPTQTKGYDEGLPANAIRAVRAAVESPVFAIGGVTPARLPELLALGLSHFAVSSAILDARKPGLVVESLRAGIERGTRS